jgi:hypothetical protein
MLRTVFFVAGMLGVLAIYLYVGESALPFCVAASVGLILITLLSQ